MLNDIINELLDSGVIITLYKTDGISFYDLNVNFKSSITLYSDLEKVMAYTRYNVTEVKTTKDIVLIHFEWYIDAGKRWQAPILQDCWRDLYMKYHLTP